MSTIVTFEDMSPSKKMTKAKITLKRERPFFGTVVGYLEEIETDSLPTAGVTEDGKLLYNPDFIDSLTKEETIGILAHEVLHPALKLFERQQNRDNSITNMAHDLVINYILVHQNGFKLPNSIDKFRHTIPDPEEVDEPFRDIIEDEEERLENTDDDFLLIPDRNGTFERPEQGIKIEDIDTKNFEKVYAELYDQTDSSGMSESGMGASISKGENGDVTISVGGEVYSVDEADFPCEVGESGEVSESKDWDKILSHAESNAKHRGDESGNIEDIVNAEDSERIDYKTYIRNALSSRIPDDYTYTRKSDAGRATGVYLPDTDQKTHVDLVVAIDTSGSISVETLEVFVGEICSITQQFDSVDITVIQHDSEVKRTEKYKNARASEFKNMDIEGRGGTDHIPVFEEIEDMNLNRRCFVVCLTDGYTKIPQEIPIRPDNLLWVLNNYEIDSEKIDYGQIARIDIDN